MPDLDENPQPFDEGHDEVHGTLAVFHNMFLGTRTAEAQALLRTLLADDFFVKLNTTDAAELIRDTMGTALVAGAGITITPNDAGDQITIVASTPPFVGAIAQNNANQTINNAASTGINFASEVVDPDNAFAGSAYVVPAGRAGKYRLWASVYWTNGAAAPTNGLELYFRRNGTSINPGYLRIPIAELSGSSEQQSRTLNALITANVGDSLDVGVTNNTGQAITILGASGTSSFGVEYRGA